MILLFQKKANYNSSKILGRYYKHETLNVLIYEKLMNFYQITLMNLTDGKR